MTVLDDLAANERTVLRRRFGLEGDPPETLEAIGRRLSLSRERIRQIEGRTAQAPRPPGRPRYRRDRSPVTPLHDEVAP